MKKKPKKNKSSRFDEDSLRKLLTKILKEKNLYEESDNELIDMLIEQMILKELALEDIAQRGIQINVRKDVNEPPFYNLNQSLAVVNQCVKNIGMLFTKLSITPQEKINQSS